MPTSLLAPALALTCKSDAACPGASGHDPWPAVKILGRASSVSKRKGCAFRVAGFGDDPPGEPPFTTTCDQRNRIDRPPPTATTSKSMRTSTTSSGDSPDKVPRFPPARVTSPVQLDTVVRASPCHWNGCPGQVASWPPRSPTTKSVRPSHRVTGVPAYQAGIAPASAPQVRVLIVWRGFGLQPPL